MYARTDVPLASAPRTGAPFASLAGSASTKTFAALSFAYYVVGTMGVLTPQVMAQREVTSNGGLQYRHPVKAPVGAPETAAIALQPTPAQDVDRIRRVLKPTMLELANLFGVSRQAVYDWQSGAQPNAQIGAKLAQLALAADVFAEAGVAVKTQTLRRKMTGGASLLDAVLNGDNSVQLAQSLVGTLQRENSQRERMTQQLAGRQRGPINSSDYGAPSLTENA
jgi:transcriptional regulator with XRE-family HTH domain